MIAMMAASITVIKPYKATKDTELSVSEGDDIHVIDATAYIQVHC